jgi:hypothetical protein
MVASINASTSAGVVTTADTSGILQLQTASTAALTIDASQNVGIGTTTINNVVTTYRGAGVNNYIQFTNSTTGTASTDGCLIGVSADDTSLRLRVLEAASIIFTTSDTERMRINSSGNVGIGTTSPQRKVSIVGADGASGQTEGNSRTSLFLDNNGANYLSIFTSTSGDGGVFFSDNGSNNGGMVYETSNDALYFKANNAERMRITSAGELLVGKTASSQTVAGCELRPDSAYFAQTGTALYTNMISGTGVTVQFRQAASPVGSISVTASATAYNTSSDYRLKENIAPMTSALTTVSQLKPVTYKWKKDGSNGQGFIAHELQAVMPDCVTGEKDAVDADGNPEYQGVDVSFLVATLTAAIQEAKALIDTQAETINALTARIVALEGV